MKTKFLLTATMGLLLGTVLVIGFINENERSEVSSPGISVTTSPSRQESRKLTSQSKPRTEDLLQVALAEPNPTRRQELLRQWADAVETGQMADLLSRLGSIIRGAQSSEVSQALLSSWIQRDKRGMATWFGNRNAVDALHARSRELLVKALMEGKPDESLSWMEKSISQTECRELYGPFFQMWTKSDPTAAGAKLRQLSGTSSGNSGAWDNLIAQVAGQWAMTDLNNALAWAKSLRDGPAKSGALEQVIYQWARHDPQDAAFYAAQQKDPALFDAVASTWAANDPRDAANWAFGLPAGDGRNTAVATAMTAWAQVDARAAAAYVSGLLTEELRNQGKLAIASSWSYQNPAEAAQWVDQFPEGAIRTLALEKVVDNWARQNSDVAGQWLQHLPLSLSRDVAVGAFCKVIDVTQPDVSFKWAETISDTAIRNGKLENAAISWLETNPAVARQSIAQSSLPEDIKEQLMAADVSQKSD